MATATENAQKIAELELAFAEFQAAIVKPSELSSLQKQAMLEALEGVPSIDINESHGKVGWKVTGIHNNVAFFDNESIIGILTVAGPVTSESNVTVLSSILP